MNVIMVIMYWKFSIDREASRMTCTSNKYYNFDPLESNVSTEWIVIIVSQIPLLHDGDVTAYNTAVQLLP